MEKVIEEFEKAIVRTMVLLAVLSIIGGFITGMWHCFLLAGMCLAISFAVWNEEK